MGSLINSSAPTLILLMVFSVTMVPYYGGGAQMTQQHNTNHSVSAVFVFGDSLVDSGNNNHIQTMFRTNHAPYGMDIAKHVPPGRASNGEVYPDLMGVRRMFVAGLPPLGCLPIVITLKSNSSNPNRNCLEEYSAVSRAFNRKLQNEISAMQLQLIKHGVKIVYVDIYQPTMDIIQDPEKYGFVFPKIGCCGTGLFEIATSCNSESQVCRDRSKYIFFDAIHPTKKATSITFNSMRNVIDLLIKD